LTSFGLWRKQKNWTDIEEQTNRTFEKELSKQRGDEPSVIAEPGQNKKVFLKNKEKKDHL
jgi:hypothetical protein